MKFSFPLALLAALALCACNTLENRRSLYSNQKVHGPYTRGLEEGTWGETKPVDEQFAESQVQQRHPKLIPGETTPPPSGLPVVNPDSSLPR